ncbi:Fic family protein [Candidatus Soleaferrea massiliensis]|uniref:Fic family protein n=1 Tax=Candidatus Soleaferrea massiliensis TaxID=1470354 RepID=UPI000B336FBB|nr:Fic family protein [Candidatus Soleaferrea massiliensis]
MKRVDDMDFTELDILQAKLASMRPLNKAELSRLRDEFVIENTYNSNAIEGNTLTLRETALILQEGITIAEKPLKEHLEAIGHKDAFEYVLSLADAKTPLTERIIKDIHSLVLMNDAANKGVYRSLPVTILGALHTPPQPYLIPVQMERLLTDYEMMTSSMHIIEAVSEFHLRFERIHPFIDGNGRTGRLILNLELIKAGYLPVNIKFTDRRKYYEAFDAYHSKESSDSLTQLVGGYELEELKKRIEMLEGQHKAGE